MGELRETKAGLDKACLEAPAPLAAPASGPAPADSPSVPPKKKPSRVKRIVVLAVLVVALIVFVAIGCAVVFLQDGYHADDAAKQALQSDAAVAVSQDESAGLISFVGPDDDVSNTYGLVLYPGANVDAECYAPLLHELAARGWVCVVAEMPFDFAFFRSDAANDVFKKYPQVEHWYIGGHSLGGIVASSYAANHTESLDGVVLLASYSIADLTQSGFGVYSVFGTNDQVLSKEQYSQALSNLPADSFHELVIQGGNHAQFGSYGAQAGDGQATISAAQQVEETADFIDAAKIAGRD